MEVVSLFEEGGDALADLIECVEKARDLKGVASYMLILTDSGGGVNRSWHTASAIHTLALAGALVEAANDMLANRNMTDWGDNDDE